MKRLALVLNYLDQKASTNINFLNGMVLRKASLDEVNLIKPYIDKLFNVANDVNIYEYGRSDNGHVTRSSYIKNKENWNYWVIDLGGEIYFQPKLLCLFMANPQILVSAVLTINDDGRTGFHTFNWSNIILNQIVDSSRRTTVIEPETINFINDVQKYNQNFEVPQFNFIRKAKLDYMELNLVPPSSYLRVIGQFAIIENLIVSNEKGSGSITQQLKSKLNLINNRSDYPINISDYIKGPDTITYEVIVEKLYGFRSTIAHGNEFKQKNMELLNYPSKTRKLLRDILSRTLLAAMKEPELFSDLRKI